LRRIGGMKTALERLLQALEEGTYRATPVGVKAAIADLRLEVEGDPEALVARVLEEAWEETRRVLEGFWAALGVLSPPPVVEKALREGEWVEASCSESPRGEAQLVLRLRERGTAVHLPVPRPLPSGGFSLEARVGRVEAHVTPGLFARKERAYLRTFRPEEVEEVLGRAKALRPLFLALGLGDLEEALEALANLEEGEARMWGPYFLARELSFRALRRGTLFGSPGLDKAFLLTGEATLSCPHGAAIALQASLWKHRITLLGMELRWDEEVVRVGAAPGEDWNALDRNPVASLVRRGLYWGLERPRTPLSPKMEALVRELRESEDPLEALKTEAFFRRVRLRALSRS
jgi:hypothetical protein